MTEENPYATPETDPVLIQQPAAGQLELATPSERFVGSLIDGLIGLALVIPLWGAAFLFGWISSMEDMGRVGFLFTLGLTVVHFVLLMAIQWKWLKATGQTIGKKVAKTRIVTMDGKKPEAKDIVLKRYAFVSAISLVPVIGGVLALVDALLVFKSDRRCLHDMVAGTQVVKFRPGDSVS